MMILRLIALDCEVCLRTVAVQLTTLTEVTVFILQQYNVTGYVYWSLSKETRGRRYPREDILFCTYIWALSRHQLHGLEL